MSLLLYSGPRRKKKWSARGKEELDFEDLARKAKAARKWIDPKLRIEELVKNKPLPVSPRPLPQVLALPPQPPAQFHQQRRPPLTSQPCSLNDFMDYLVYVEREAEALQFFLWYYDYVHRWAKLPAADRAAAPKWDAGDKRVVAAHGRKGSFGERAKLSSILDILDGEAGESRGYHRRHQSSATNFSLPRSPEAVAAGEKGNWERCKSSYPGQPVRWSTD